MKKVDYKKLLLYIVITLIIGTIPSIFVFKNIGSLYSSLNKPPLSPPGFIFPVVWSILYILMGISLYRVMKSNNKYKSEFKLIYFIQLAVNALWTPIFFGFREYFLAFVWILMLIVLVINMLFILFKIDKISLYLQIPYLLWLLFASYLNFYIFVLN